MFEPGVMFWAERDNLEMARSLGVSYGQLGIPGGMQLTAEAAAKWKSALDAAGFTLVTVFAAYEGEDYTDIPAVARYAWGSSRRPRARCVWRERWQ